MDNKQGMISCALGCWLVAALAGFLAAVLLWVLGSWTFLQGAFMGAVVFAVAGLLLSWVVCRPLPRVGEAGADSKDAARAKAEEARAAAAARSAEAAAAAPSPTQAAAVTAPAAPTVSGGVAATSALAGEDDLAARKGAWSYDAGSDAKTDAANASKAATGAAPSAGATSADAASSAAKSAAKAAASETAPDSAAKTKTDAKADAGSAAKTKTDAKADAGSAAKTKTDAKADAGSAAKAKSTAAKTAAADSAETTPDYDGDGVLEGTDEGTKPAGLDGPRDGKADNLKEIKGIGPKLEGVCNDMGYYHFDQIAAWTPDEVAWVNANLIGFKGRVTRDNWIEQAKILAAGGDTEFSKRVEGGNVY